MMALADKLRLNGRYAVLFATVEMTRTEHTVQRVVAVVVRTLQLAAEAQLAVAEQPPAETALNASDPSTRMYAFLRHWSLACPRPLVLLIDEIDCLQDDGLVSVLSQFRSGYAERPKAFAHSVCIFGMRDVRDDKVLSGGSTSSSSGRWQTSTASRSTCTGGISRAACLSSRSGTRTGRIRPKRRWSRSMLRNCPSMAWTVRACLVGRKLAA